MLGHLARSNIEKGLLAVGERAGFDPVERAEAAFENGLGGVPEIGGRIGVGADEGDFLQRHAPDVETAFAGAETDVNDDAAGARRSRSGSTGRLEADSIDHQVGGADRLDLGIEHVEIAGFSTSARLAGLVSAIEISAAPLAPRTRAAPSPIAPPPMTRQRASSIGRSRRFWRGGPRASRRRSARRGRLSR